MDVEKMFSLAVEHFVARRDVVEFLSVTVSAERWFQFELAALIDRNRDSLGIGGTIAGTDASKLAGGVGPSMPRWLVTCERAGSDIWVGDYTNGYRGAAASGVAIELKSIVNNKNFDDRVWSIRQDLSLTKRVPQSDVAPSRWGIVIASYTRYLEESGSSYPILRENGRDVPADGFWTRLDKSLRSGDLGDWGHTPALEVVKSDSIASLARAPYIQGEDSEVRMFLVRPSS